MPGRTRLARLALTVRIAWAVASSLRPETLRAILANSVSASVTRWRERRSRAPWSVTRTPGRLLSFVELRAQGQGGHAVAVGARCTFAEAELEVRFLAPDVVRVSWGGDPEPVPYASCAWHASSATTSGARGNQVQSEGGGVSVEVSAEGGGCRVASAALVVEVGSLGTVRYLTPDGRRLREDLPVRRRGAQRSVASVLRPGEVVSGLGEVAAGIDRRGRSYRWWNRDPGGRWGPGTDPLYSAIPVLTCVHPDGDVLVFYENSYRALVRIDGHEPALIAEPTMEVTFAGGMLRYYVIAGPLPQMLERYAALTGRPPMPPRWALGYHQCRWGYRDEVAIREVADGFRAERLPLSAVHLDIDYMDGFRVFTVDRGRFPSLATLSQDLLEGGTRVVTIIDPGVKVDDGYDVYRDGLAKGRFVREPDGSVAQGVVWPGRAAFPDFTDAGTREWWAGWYRRLTDLGVAGVWHDMNEPTSITLWGDPSLPEATPFAFEGRGGRHLEAHNLYGLLMDQAGYQALAEALCDRRPFVVSRSGWAGVQRWAWIWTGDAESTWSGLRQQVATVIGLGLSGVPFAGPDIGGFFGAPSPELFVRWLELSVFLPYCRTHAVVGAPPREPWRFPEPFRGAVGSLIRLRYRLLPYLYTLAYEASLSGRPLVRPAWWPTPGDAPPEGAATGTATASGPVDDQFLLGDALLVAPVARPGRRVRRVWLPPAVWHHFRPLDTDAGTAEPARRGGCWIELDAPLGKPHVLVRAGSVVPLDDAWSGTGPRTPSRLSASHQPVGLTLHCWTDDAGCATGTVYSDDGDGDGPHRFERVRLEPKDGAQAGRPGRLLLRRDARGEYPPPSTVRIVLHGLAVTSASAAGSACKVERFERHSSAVVCPGDATEVLLVLDGD